MGRLWSRFRSLTEDERGQLRAALAVAEERSRRAKADLAAETQARKAAEYEARRVERRRAELDHASKQAAAEIERVRGDLVVLRGSRTWRFTRGVLRWMRRLRLRKPTRNDGALPRAVAELGAISERLGVTPPRLTDGSLIATAAQPAAEAHSDGRGAAERRSPTEQVPSRPGPVGSGSPVAEFVVDLPSPPVPQPRAGKLLDLGEEAATRRFLRHYALTMGFSNGDGDWEAAGIEDPLDTGGVLVPSHRASAPSSESRVDIVVCVHNALDDVRRCLWSLFAKTARPFHLILVDDGSEEDTRRFLESFVARHPAATLISNPDPPHGYTVAANIGLRTSAGDIVVFLNSDTIVSHRWLDGVVDCIEADPSCGMAGPLSNAASHQSIPHKREGDAWAVNELPPWLTADGMALLLRRRGPPERPSLPFLNGFCLAVRREVIDAVGEFDEELFGPGYCEENDYCVRVADAGFSLRVADDSYVHHAKGGSYGRDDGGALAKEHRGRFYEKHGESRMRERVEVIEADTSLDSLRASIAAAARDPAATRDAFRAACPNPLTVGFVMPNMALGGSGGLHSVYQETSGMRRLGVDAVIFASSDYMPNARAAYDDADELFVGFDHEGEIEMLSRGRDVLVATHFKSLPMVADVWSQRRDFMAAYYVQDYEPFFAMNVNGGTAELAEARASYDLIPDMLLFAKTHWICNAVGRAHGRPVAKVEPSIDETLFNPGGREAHPDRPVRVVGMVRPRTWRRRPFTTLMLLDRLKAEFGDRVEVTSFGCTQERLELMLSGREHRVDHLGVLTRPDVAALLKRSDMFLDVSVFQGMGRTGFEAMTCGCTPVVPRVGGTHEYAVDGENALLVDTAHPASVYSALRDLVGDRERLARMQEAGQRDGRRRSVLAAALSEYVLFEHEYERRFRTRASGLVGAHPRAEQARPPIVRDVPLGV